MTQSGSERGNLEGEASQASHEGKQRGRDSAIALFACESSERGEQSGDILRWKCRRSSHENNALFPAN